MAKQNKRKPRPSWFQKQIERVGEEGLLRKQPIEIQREAFNIIRDITRGNITKRDFKYLFNTTVLANVKHAVYEKYIEQHVYQSTMACTMQIPNGMQILEINYKVDPMSFQKIYNTTQNLLTAYTVILQGIDAMIATMQYEYPSDEARELQYLQVYSSVQNQISRFKYII